MMFSELKSKWKDVESRRILSLIDRQRVNNFSIQTNGLFFDYSKTNIDEDTLGLLLDLIKKSSLHEKREAMFSGKKLILLKTERFYIPRYGQKRVPF